MIPDEAIRQAFLEREDIITLPPDEQEIEFQKALVNINKLRDLFSDSDSYVIETA